MLYQLSELALYWRSPQSLVPSQFPLWFITWSLYFVKLLSSALVRHRVIVSSHVIGSVPRYNYEKLRKPISAIAFLFSRAVIFIFKSSYFYFREQLFLFSRAVIFIFERSYFYFREQLFLFSRAVIFIFGIFTNFWSRALPYFMYNNEYRPDSGMAPFHKGHRTRSLFLVFREHLFIFSRAVIYIFESIYFYFQEHLFLFSRAVIYIFESIYLYFQEHLFIFSRAVIFIFESSYLYFREQLFIFSRAVIYIFKNIYLYFREQLFFIFESSYLLSNRLNSRFFCLLYVFHVIALLTVKHRGGAR